MREKVKLATALIGISSIHLLKTFVQLTFVASALLLAWTGPHIVGDRRRSPRESPLDPPLTRTDIRRAAQSTFNRHRCLRLLQFSLSSFALVLTLGSGKASC
jgi:hypothetical protein